MSQLWAFCGLRDAGSPTLGSPVVIVGGVVIIDAPRDTRIRALDAAIHAELRSDSVEVRAVTSPPVITPQGVDYVVFAVGGNTIPKPEGPTRRSPIASVTEGRPGREPPTAADESTRQRPDRPHGRSDSGGWGSVSA